MKDVIHIRIFLDTIGNCGKKKFDCNQYWKVANTGKNLLKY
jgi:hypothetical protein